MGFFSGLFPSSTRTDVSTSVQRVIPDNLLPDSVKKGTITAVLRDGSIAEYVAEETIASIGTSAERMYAYGRDKYKFKNPTVDLVLVSQNEDVLLDVLQRMHNTDTIDIEYSYYGPPNFIHVGWIKLVEDFNYDPTTNEIVKLSTVTKKVFLKDMVLVSPSAGTYAGYSAASTSVYGPAPSSGAYPGKDKSIVMLGALEIPTGVVIDPAVTGLQLLVSYVWEEEETYTMAGTTATFTRKVVKEDDMILSTTGYPDKEHFQVRYKANGQTDFFMYEYGSKQFPTLDAKFDAPAKKNMGKFFPFGYVRYNKVSARPDTDVEQFKDSKRLFKYIGMDLETISNAISQNPEIDKVEQAILMMGVPTTATDQVSLRYLFDFFNKLYFFLPVTYKKTLATAMEAPPDVPPTSGMGLLIKDERFKMSLTTFGVQRRRKAGRIGKKGVYATKEEIITTPAIKDEDSWVASAPVIDARLVYMYQVTENTYDEVSIQGLSLQYHIWGDYSVSATIGDPKLLIPLDYSITSKYPITYREDLYAKSLHLVFNAVVQTEVQWYESGAFKLVMLIVAIVITVYSYGADGGSAIATALGLSGAVGLIATIIVTILIGQMMPSVYKLFVRVLGKDAANALALIAVIYGGYKIIDSGSIAGAPFATDLIQLGMNLHQAVIAQEFLDLQTEAEDFGRYAAEQTELLKKSQDLLKQDTLLSPLVIFGESPEDFYNRTIHSGNIGVVGIDAVSMYVASALTLPKLNETLGENNV
jgi:hypothetical protein